MSPLVRILPVSATLIVQKTFPYCGAWPLVCSIRKPRLNAVSSKRRKGRQWTTTICSRFSLLPYLNSILCILFSCAYPVSIAARFDFCRLLRLKDSSRFKAFSAIRRSNAKFCGAWPVRTRQASSLNVTSKVQCRPFSIPQCRRIACPSLRASQSKLVNGTL